MAQQQQPRQSPQIESARPAGGVVTVACKVPNGLQLRVFDMIDVEMPVMGGGIKIAKQAQVRPESVKIEGPAAPVGKHPNAPVVGGYALTHNVPRDFWDKWLHDNRDSHVVKNHLIFAHENRGRVVSEAKEDEKSSTGFEPIDPENPRQVIGPDNKKRIKIVKADVNEEDL